MSKILVAFYGEIDGFPPTINMLNSLEKMGFQVTTLSMDNPALLKNYNEKVSFYQQKRTTKKNSNIFNRFSNLLDYVGFFWKFSRLKNEINPKIILAYDPIAFVMGNILFSRKRNILWYHNHDVMDLNKNSTMLQRIIQRIEMKSMRNLDFFTIPSKERIKYFNFNRFSGKIGVIPNYPSIKIYKGFFTNREMNNDEFHILYQGSIGSGHGIENIIKLLGRNRILHKNIFLNLKGKIAFNYKKELMTLAKECSFEKNILFHDYTPYFEVPKLTSRCHLGIAIFLKDDIMNSTLGSASNKIYEYAAVGTPIIYFKNEHFTNYLETHSWALGSDLSNDSLIRLIQFTDKNFKYLSDKAHLSFLSEFNFEAASKSFLEEYILKYSNSQHNNQQT